MVLKMHSIICEYFHSKVLAIKRENSNSYPEFSTFPRLLSKYLKLKSNGNNFTVSTNLVK